MIAGDRGPTIVEVVTPWCGACRSMRPDIAATAAAHADLVDFVVVDATETPEIARELDISGTPTILGYRDGNEVLRVRGRRSRAELEQMFDDVADPPGGRPPPQRRVDQVLRVSAGLVLMALGGLAGPSWSLLALGVATTWWGMMS